MNWMIYLIAVLALACAYGNTMELKATQFWGGNAMEVAASAAGVVTTSALFRPQPHSVSVSVSGAEGRYERRHPEQKPDEVFETNCSVDQFGRTPYRTKRAGKVAYDVHGREISRDIPVFIEKAEWEAVREMRKDGKYVLHFWTRNIFFADAQVTLTGVENCRSDGKKTEVTFQLKREKNLGRSWESNVIIPKVFCPIEIVVKPKNKKAIRFLFYSRVEEGGRVNLLLSSCPLPETFTRPRAIISQDGATETRRWSATFRVPDNMPALFR